VSVIGTCAAEDAHEHRGSTESTGHGRRRARPPAIQLCLQGQTVIIAAVLDSLLLTDLSFDVPCHMEEVDKGCLMIRMGMSG